MSSAMRMQSEQSTDTVENKESFLKAFVGDAYTPELLACFTSEIENEGNISAYEDME